VADSRLTDLLSHLRAGLASQEASRSDHEALQAFLARQDEAAFESIMKRHGPMVYRVCQRVLHHAHDAEEAFQATFLVLARQAKSIGKSESLASWLHGVAFRVAKRLRRDAARQRSRELAATLANVPDPADDLLWRDVQFFLEKEIDSLPENYRRVFILCILEGRSRPEVARELGLNENTVSSRLARAGERLQQRLATRGISLSAVMAALTLAETGSGSALSQGLLLETSRAATQYAAHQPITGLSPLTQQLAKDTARTMTLSKFSYFAGSFALAGMLAFTAWGLSQEKEKPQGTPLPNGRIAVVPDPEPKQLVADSTQRKRSLSNLTKLMTAMNAYYKANGRFPSKSFVGSKPDLLSWRVALLPYLGHEGLYKQFKLEEPWDSEHNKKLLSQMPEVYRAGFEPKDSFDTYYQRIAFKMVAYGKENGVEKRYEWLQFSERVVEKENPLGNHLDVIDGASKTISIFECGPAVPWTKPADFQWNEHFIKPIEPRLVFPFSNECHVVAYDGSAYSIPSNRSNTFSFLLLLHPNDRTGIAPSFHALQTRFTADTEETKKAPSEAQIKNQKLLDQLQKQIKDAQGVEQAEAIQEQLQAILDDLSKGSQQLSPTLGK
jgi:RNA polymerase sigma factor (sigma-70 family)